MITGRPSIISDFRLALQGFLCGKIKEQLYFDYRGYTQPCLSCCFRRTYPLNVQDVQRTTGDGVTITLRFECSKV